MKKTKRFLLSATFLTVTFAMIGQGFERADMACLGQTLKPCPTVQLLIPEPDMPIGKIPLPPTPMIQMTGTVGSSY
jgi:hypothetical protein